MGTSKNFRFRGELCSLVFLRFILRCCDVDYPLGSEKDKNMEKVIILSDEKLKELACDDVINNLLGLFVRVIC